MKQANAKAKSRCCGARIKLQKRQFNIKPIEYCSSCKQICATEKVKARRKISDKQRLDWLAKNHWKYTGWATGEKNLVSRHLSFLCYGKNLRQAIDASMRSGRK